MLLLLLPAACVKIVGTGGTNGGPILLGGARVVTCPTRPIVFWPTVGPVLSRLAHYTPFAHRL